MPYARFVISLTSPCSSEDEVLAYMQIAVPGSSPALGGEVFNRKRGSNAHSLSLSPAYCPDMIEILDIKYLNCKSLVWSFQHFD